VPVPWGGASLEQLRDELDRNAHLWFMDQSRQQRIRVQENTQSIFLRAARRSPTGPKSINDVQESAETQWARNFPRALGLLERIRSQLKASLGRALYVRLAPGTQVYPHIDAGTYYIKRDRYHLVIESEGSIMRCGGEQVTMRNGELWWFDNKIEHESSNPSDTWRTHLIFDLCQGAQDMLQANGSSAAEALPTARCVNRLAN
jgi:hypothetical protein